MYSRSFWLGLNFVILTWGSGVLAGTAWQARSQLSGYAIAGDFQFAAIWKFDAASPRPVVVEFYNSALDNYFITADPNEQFAVSDGAAGPGWALTGG